MSNRKYIKSKKYNEKKPIKAKNLVIKNREHYDKSNSRNVIRFG